MESDLIQRIERIERILCISNTREINEDYLNSFIDDLINKDDMIPDYVEKLFYKKVLGITMRALQKSIENVKIDLFNHTITAEIKPK